MLSAASRSVTPPAACGATRVGGVRGRSGGGCATHQPASPGAACLPWRPAACLPQRLTEHRVGGKRQRLEVDRQAQPALFHQQHLAPTGQRIHQGLQEGRAPVCHSCRLCGEHHQRRRFGGRFAGGASGVQQEVGLVQPRGGDAAHWAHKRRGLRGQRLWDAAVVSEGGVQLLGVCGGRAVVQVARLHRKLGGGTCGGGSGGSGARSSSAAAGGNPGPPAPTPTRCPRYPGRLGSAVAPDQPQPARTCTPSTTRRLAGCAPPGTAPTHLHQPQQHDRRAPGSTAAAPESGPCGTCAAVKDLATIGARGTAIHVSGRGSRGVGGSGSLCCPHVLRHRRRCGYRRQIVAGCMQRACVAQAPISSLSAAREPRAGGTSSCPAAGHRSWAPRQRRREDLSWRVSGAASCVSRGRFAVLELNVA